MAARRLRPLAVALLSCAAMAWSASVHAGPPESASPVASESEAEIKAKAKAEAQTAIAAFEQGDYALALVHFEAAMALRPAPKLHYNIAVCHQRLALQTDDPEQRTRHREQAIDSYNRYLEQNPGAEDRGEVAAIVRELGGTPVVNTPIKKPVFEGGGTPSEGGEGPREGGEVTPDAAPLEPPPTSKPPSPPHHGRFGVLLGLGVGSSLIGNRDVAAPVLFNLDLHGGGFVGPKRRVLLAAQTSIYTGGSLRSDRLSFWGLHLGLLAEHQWVVARERLAIGLGGLAGLASQSVAQGTNAAPPLCSIGSGTQVAGRNGGQFAARLHLALLVGPRRRGMLSVLLQPTVDVFGRPRGGQDCLPGQSPWEALDMTERWQILMFAGAGFSLRF
jgi:tetratricopeptide (TPR) repeat protein